jgi:hypothetical protein
MTTATCNCGHDADDHAGGVCYHILSDAHPLFDCQCNSFQAAS